jgi:transposase InsO family protein
MGEKDVEETLEVALKVSGLERARVRHRPRLLSDNGPAYLSNDLKKFLKTKNMQHIRGAPYHPMTQGKIERFHRSMKNIVKLQNYYFPSELEQAISEFMEFYNHERFHESLDNLTPADVYFGRNEEVLSRREKIKEQTLRLRRKHNLQPARV